MQMDFQMLQKVGRKAGYQQKGGELKSSAEYIAKAM